MIYVDRLMACVPNRIWRWSSACHLFADDQAELHRFAARLGLKRAWYQDHPRLPHYDLTARMRIQAVRLGAQEVDRRFVKQFIQRRAGREGSPSSSSPEA